MDDFLVGFAMIRRRGSWLTAILLTILVPPECRAQTHSAFPVDFVAGPSPQPVIADGRAHLLYELHLTNFSASPIVVLALDVLGGDGAATPLASYRGEELEKLLVPIGQNAGNNEESRRHITLDNVVGNYLILDLGHERFALYAHLQPGSVRVKLGDSVKAEQVLARLGNSGNSDAPHLHFQLTDANSPLGAEGFPYEIEGFTQLGVSDDPSVLDSGQAWRPKGGEALTVHRREFPANNAVVTFP
jgi:hypothetical protein